MKQQLLHKGEVYAHKDGSGIVTIDVMFESDTYYTCSGGTSDNCKWYCDTKAFKRMYIRSI